MSIGDFLAEIEGTLRADAFRAGRYVDAHAMARPSPLLTVPAYTRQP